MPGTTPQAIPATAASSSGSAPSRARSPTDDGDDGMDALRLETHVDRAALCAKMAEGKGTETAYARHVRNYEAFWQDDQDKKVTKNPLMKPTAALPITATKVCQFLKHEMQRNTVCVVLSFRDI